MSGTVAFGEMADAWKRDPAFRAEYERQGPAMELAFALAGARHEAALTQAEVARRMGTSQATVARLESGRVMPSWNSIERFARAVGRRPVVTLQAAE